MFSFIDVNSSMFFSIMKNITNQYEKNEIKLIKVITENPTQYKKLSEKAKLNEKVIDIALSKHPSNFSDLPEKIKANKEKILEYINYYYIHPHYLNQEQKKDIDIATNLIKKNGEFILELSHFKNNKELISLANKTSNLIEIFPNSEEYKEEIYNSLLNATEHENSKNFNSFNDNFKYLLSIPEVVVELIKKKNISNYTTSNFITRLLDINNPKLKKLTYEIIELNPKLYSDIYKLKTDCVCLSHYIQYCKLNNIKYSIPLEILNESKKNNISVEEYIEINKRNDLLMLNLDKKEIQSKKIKI